METSCIPCDATTYKDVSGSTTACITCGSHEVSAAPFVECALCDSGWGVTTVGVVGCTECSVANNNTWDNATDASPCGQHSECDAGFGYTHTHADDDDACIACVAGQSFSAIRDFLPCTTTLTTCSATQYVSTQPTAATDTVCTACEAGFRCDQTNRIPCAVGRYSNAGAQDCTDCGVGKYLDIVGSSSATACKVYLLREEC